MKVFTLSLVFALLAITTLVHAQEPEESCAAFRVRIDCSYIDNVAVQCSEADLDMIGNVAHAIVEMDYIMARLGPDAPQFDLAYEIFGDDVVVDHTGDFFQTPSEEEIEAHLTPQDEIQVLLYEGSTSDPDSVSNSPSSLPSSSPSKKPTNAPTQGPPGGGRVRRLQEGDVNLDSPGKSNWQPFGTYRQEGNGRDLAGIDCGSLKKCTKSWCCALCGVNCRRRRLSWSDIHKDQSSLRGLQQSEYEIQKADYLMRVERMETRVSKLLTEKMRYLALRETIACLGIYWELEVEFSTTLADTYPGPDEIV
jgi:hypothetical protein